MLCNVKIWSDIFVVFIDVFKVMELCSELVLFMECVFMISGIMGQVKG